MEPSLRAELDALRNRAFGPSADIGADPDALRRLAELERLAQTERSAGRIDEAPAGENATGLEPEIVAPQHPEPLPEANAARTASVTAVVDPEPVTVQAPERVTDTASPTGTEQGRPLRPSRRDIPRVLWAIWGVSLVVAIALSAFATYGLVRIAPVAVSQGGEQIASLDPNPGVEVPSGWMGAGPSSRTWEFYGLTFFETAYGGMGNGGECFVIALTDDVPTDFDPTQDGYAVGLNYSACRSGSFPATITMAVDSASPPELRERFGGRSLQFVKDGDRIGVFEGSRPSD